MVAAGAEERSRTVGVKTVATGPVADVEAEEAAKDKGADPRRHPLPVSVQTTRNMASWPGTVPTLKAALGKCTKHHRETEIASLIQHKF